MAFKVGFRLVAVLGSLRLHRGPLKHNLRMLETCDHKLKNIWLLQLPWHPYTVRQSQWRSNLVWVNDPCFVVSERAVLRQSMAACTKLFGRFVHESCSSGYHCLQQCHQCLWEEWTLANCIKFIETCLAVNSQRMRCSQTPKFTHKKTVDV